MPKSSDGMCAFAVSFPRGRKQSYLALIEPQTGETSKGMSEPLPDNVVHHAVFLSKDYTH
ncbi:hypothetical protein DS031_15705 [Bacillus taeanensis]|uniref:Uncharacterized protein n=1 Tax=Bacillus taeanensis TaxID=273032 RepID=A0A366XTX6_9BACI|nr:hypothetical protein DS031_15705 [Bacillus taeanensis]